MALPDPAGSANACVTIAKLHGPGQSSYERACMRKLWYNFMALPNQAGSAHACVTLA